MVPLPEADEAAAQVVHRKAQAEMSRVATPIKIIKCSSTMSLECIPYSKLTRVLTAHLLITNTASKPTVSCEGSQCAVGLTRLYTHAPHAFSHSVMPFRACKLEQGCAY